MLALAVQVDRVVVEQVVTELMVSVPLLLEQTIQLLL